MEQLREICNYAKHHAEPSEVWSFEKHAVKRGINVSFSGIAGTGKTMAAEIIAGELNFDMYKTDLSEVVSKYIGETVKNLNRIFEEAEKRNWVFFSMKRMLYSGKDLRCEIAMTGMRILKLTIYFRRWRNSKLYQYSRQTLLRILTLRFSEDSLLILSLNRFASLCIRSFKLFLQLSNKNRRDTG